MLGKLSLSAIPFNNPIIIGAFGFMIFCVFALAALVTYLHRWKWLWKEWLTSVDHKRIGVMYIIVAVVMGLRGFADVVMMRSQLALSSGASQGYLPPEHYDQIFSAHGVIMIFFMAMPFMIGLINLSVPLQIGARDVAFPFLNAVSFWLFMSGVVLVNLSLAIGEFAKTGWVAYPPLSELAYSPGVGVDYYIWSLEIAGIGTLLTGINFFVTIIMMRAPGMTLMKMPVFSWTALCTMILVIAAFPILTVVLGLLALDRYLGMHFFTNGGGGNMMLYVNLFWAWGHPEVYILVLPAFGVFSEVVATFTGKRLFGYTSMIWATIAITILSFVVWLHHFFTMGAGGDVNAVFGITTMIIAVPTGVKIFNWLFTIYRGRLRFTTPVLWTLGFIVTFVFGGMSGVMLANAPADFVLHNSQFLIAHFHNTIIGGTVFGAIAGFTYWFPKMFGFKLNEKLGRSAFLCWFVGFYLTFVPLYILGFMGMTRRLNHTDNPAWRPLLLLAAAGVAVTAVGLFLLLLQLVVSFLQRKQNADVTGDPWNGRTLEWSVSSPPPPWNFARIPVVKDRDAFWEMKRSGPRALEPADLRPIHLLRNTGAGVFIGTFSLSLGFAMIWHIWWLAIAGLLGVIVALIIRTSSDDTEYDVPVEEIAREESKHPQRLVVQG
ncbi:MAG TPA: cytochrome o ubiquinol oxidase subunit I [Spirochaetia bacterium]|nr:cytochrome o ubiquinol oxidase subunit I [Spirochaetia bacterium]